MGQPVSAANPAGRRRTVRKRFFRRAIIQKDRAGRNILTRTFVRETTLNFLVTGAAGFLGSNLANKLAKAGHQVRGLDDLSTGDPARLAPEVLFTRGDVLDRPKLWTLLQDVDCVYHLAARF